MARPPLLLAVSASRTAGVPELVSSTPSSMLSSNVSELRETKATLQRMPSEAEERAPPPFQTIELAVPEVVNRSPPDKPPKAIQVLVSSRVLRLCAKTAPQSPGVPLLGPSPLVSPPTLSSASEVIHTGPTLWASSTTPVRRNAPDPRLIEELEASILSVVPASTSRVSAPTVTFLQMTGNPGLFSHTQRPAAAFPPRFPLTSTPLVPLPVPTRFPGRLPGLLLSTMARPPLLFMSRLYKIGGVPDVVISIPSRALSVAITLLRSTNAALMRMPSPPESRTVVL